MSHRAPCRIVAHRHFWNPLGALAEFQTCLLMEINEGARDAQITMPLFVRQECSDRAAQINKRAAR